MTTDNETGGCGGGDAGISGDCGGGGLGVPTDKASRRPSFGATTGSTALPLSVQPASPGHAAPASPPGRRPSPVRAPSARLAGDPSEWFSTIRGPSPPVSPTPPPALLSPLTVPPPRRPSFLGMLGASFGPPRPLPPEGVGAADARSLVRVAPGPSRLHRRPRPPESHPRGLTYPRLQGPPTGEWRGGGEAACIHE